MPYIENIPPAVIFNQLTAHADDGSNAPVMHLFESLLCAALYRVGCPEAHVLLQYQAGLLDAAEWQTTHEHVVTCTDCQRELADIDAVPTPFVSYVGVVNPAPAQAPRPSLRERLEQAGLHVIRAFLQPAIGQPALAVRGGQTRELLYRAGDYEILLSVVPPLVSEPLWQIEGHITMPMTTGAALQGAQVHLVRQGQSVFVDGIDEFGYFLLDQVNAGSYVIHIESAPEQILIEDVVIA
ncbi:MAG: carboxypeptidase regulatory-like domain-containing protein [Chloroflexaceae bacterium]|nr:carboxypeptidase regulatory-like domain-containing protein [Chloroflexaceae bacterium]